MHLYAASNAPSTKPKSQKMKLSNYPSATSFGSLTIPQIVNIEPGQLASGLAHDVRNPLANINLAVKMFKSTTKADDREIYLDIIVHHSRRINDLVTDFLRSCQASEMELGKQTFV
jgi:signal transduction histidine kinase